MNDFTIAEQEGMNDEKLNLIKEVACLSMRIAKQDYFSISSDIISALSDTYAGKWYCEITATDLDSGACV